MAALFKNVDNMAIEKDMVEKIQEEEIEYVDDLEMVDNDFINQLIDNLKRPGGHINVGGAMVAMSDLKVFAKQQMILEHKQNIV